MSTAENNILPFPTRSDAPVTVLPTPRPHFGLRPPTREALELARQADKRLEMIRRAGEAIADAMDGASASRRKNAHPDLHKAFSARLDGIASSVRQAAEEARALGHTKTRVTLLDLAGIIETVAAEITLFLGEGDAP